MLESYSVDNYISATTFKTGAKKFVDTWCNNLFG